MSGTRQFHYRLLAELALFLFSDGFAAQALSDGAPDITVFYGGKLAGYEFDDGAFLDLGGLGDFF